MRQLQQLYYYPTAIVVAASVGSIGYKIYVVLASTEVPVILYIGIVAELLELSYYCAIGTIAENCVSH